MSRGFARFKMAIWTFALFSCFGASLNLADQINERLYIIVMYGWKAMSREGLHLTRTKPTLVVSNGDRSPEIHGFILFVSVVVFGIAFFGYGLKLMETFTSWMGRRIDVISIRKTIPEEVEDGSGRTGAKLALAILMFGPGAVAFILTITNQSLRRSFLNYAVAVVVSSLMLRITFRDLKGPLPVDVAPQSGRKT